MAGRLYFARVDAPPDAAPLRLPAGPRHAPLLGAGAGDFLILIAPNAAGDRWVCGDLELDRTPAAEAEAIVLGGRLTRRARPLSLAEAHRFLHDGSRGPADLPGGSEAEKIDAALATSDCRLDPRRGQVPKIVQFWRWLNGGG